MYMAKHSRIDMGPLTEDLPEWSISPEINVQDLKKKETKPDRGERADAALDSGFVLDGTITSPRQGNPHVKAETAETNSLLDEGGALPKQPVDDTLQMLGDAEGSITSFDAEQVLDAEHISSRDTLREADTLLSVPQEDFDTSKGLLDTQQERKKVEIAGQFLDEGLFFEQPMEAPSKPRKAEMEELIFEPSLEQLMDQPAEPKAEEAEEPYNSPTLEQLLEESGAEAVLNEASELEAVTVEHDVVAEHLGYLANSTNDWEQSENALSEAAAMLLNISGERTKDEEKEELQSLRQGLDSITASIHRMSASAREDMADVIEQTQRDNELSEAVQAETVTTERTIQSFGQEPEQTSEVRKTVQMRTLEPLDESVSSGMDVDQILEKYKSLSSETEKASMRQTSGPAAEMKRQTVEQPAANSRPIVMKTLTPLDESETSGMNVNGIAELYKKPEAKRSKRESERKHLKASKQESEQRRGKASDQEFETTIIPEGEETADGFRFVVDKGIVENPVEWRIDASFQSGGQDDPSVQTASTAENDNDVLTVSDVEDKLKKQEVEVKRRRVEKSRMENSSGFAYALSDLK